LDSLDAVFAADGTGTSVGLNVGSGKKLKLVGDVIDTNGNELLKVSATASAVNEVTLTNAATGNKPSLSATGGDTNIGFELVSKGTGEITAKVNGSTVFNASSSMGFKNRIINGAMVIDQRNAGASITPTNGQYLVDRFIAIQSVASKYSAQQNAGAVTPPTGFSNYQGVTSLSAYSSASGDQFYIGQRIEASNIGDLAFGTANAQAVTVSFWVRSSLTGTHSGSLINAPTFNRSYPFTFTVSAANTWEFKTVVIPGDTSGTWATSGTGAGLQVVFNLGSGSSFVGTAGAWNGNTNYGATGATSVVGTNGATFYITGVQLEKGSTATSFDYRPYGTELQLAQRYFFVAVTGSAKYWGMGQNYSASALTSYIQFPVTMRTAPTSASTSGTNYYGFYRNGTNDDFNSITLEAAQVQGTGFFNNSEISGTAGHSGNLYTNNTASFIAFQAEL
jgi:hypothetical protein